MNRIVVKKDNSNQPFDAKKLQSSLVKSCLSAGKFEGEARQIAKAVVHDVNDWLTNKTEIPTTELRLKTAQLLERYCQDSAYLYKNYKKII